MNLARTALSTVIRHFEHHAEIGSTNDRAAELARDPTVPLPALVVTDKQTAGRGRGANRWWSADGALTFSLVVELTGDTVNGNTVNGDTDASISATAPPRERWPLVALTAGLAVCLTLQPTVAPAPLAIKWPNDVYAAGRKLAGILVEAPAIAAATPLARVVIGIGINVNNTFAAAPPDLRQRAVSIADLTGRPSDVDATLTKIVGELLDLLPTTFASPSPLVERWRPYCMLTGRVVELDSPAGPTTGLCEGIDDDGALLLRGESGQKRCTSGTVVRW